MKRINDRRMFFNVKSLSLASGIVFALLGLLSMVFLGPMFAQQANMPNIDLGTGLLTAIATLVVMFIEGAVLGAVFGAVYNAIERREESDITRTDEYEAYQT